MKRWLFDQVHKRNLIYNQCWEDPSVDHEALNIAASDRIVTITSAGCNALDYLLRAPAGIHCVDVNPHQTALLELKLVAMQKLDYERFFQMFGLGRICHHDRVYAEELRSHLSLSAQSIWDRCIHYFDVEGPGFYFHGTSGLFARLFSRYIDFRPSLRHDLSYFQGIESLEQQRRFYRSNIAPQLWTEPIRWLMRRHSVMSLLGVPVDQIRQMQLAGISNLDAIIEERVDRTFTTIPIRTNYFWRLYINGHYTPECCPNYLKPDNFEKLRSLSHRIRFHTMTIEQFLKTNNRLFSIFVLLDHMDWLASTPALLDEEWRWILKRAAPGARIIYRSGGATFDHIPETAVRRLAFNRAFADELSARDRVGTYGSFHLASVEA